MSVIFWWKLDKNLFWISLDSLLRHLLNHFKNSFDTSHYTKIEIFHYGFLQLMWHSFTFTEEILKASFLCSASHKGLRLKKTTFSLQFSYASNVIATRTDIFDPTELCLSHANSRWSWVTNTRKAKITLGWTCILVPRTSSNYCNYCRKEKQQ